MSTNRITDIRKHEDVSFHYIPSTEIPADIASNIASNGKEVNKLLDIKLWSRLACAVKPHLGSWNQDTVNCETKKSEELYEANLFTGALFSFGEIFQRKKFL